ncbi:hypothetical protein CVT24_010727, partial [Panaeolus cyanescens]
SVKAQYCRLYKTYKAIVNLENWTGNGSGDPDLKERVEKARNAQVAIPKDISHTNIEKFYEDGFYEFFEAALMRKDPRIERKDIFHSATISDAIWEYERVESTSSEKPSAEIAIGIEGHYRGQSAPVLLYSRSFDPPAVHEIVIRNENDTRINPSGNSQITVDRFVLEIINPDPPVPPQPLSSSSGGVPSISQASSTATSAGTSLSSTTENSASATPSSNVNTTLPAITVASVTGTATPPVGVTSINGSSSSNSGIVTAVQDRQIPIGPIVGGILGGLALILALILFAYWYKRSKKSVSRTEIVVRRVSRERKGNRNIIE